MKVTIKELLKQPKGSVFIEDEITAEPLFVIMDYSNKGKDIVVMPIFSVEDGEQFRMGFSEMDQAELNSKEYYVLSESEVNTVMGRLMLCEKMVDWM